MECLDVANLTFSSTLKWQHTSQSKSNIKMAPMDHCNSTLPFQYHSHPSHFALANFFTFTWYNNTLYPLFITSTMSYSLTIIVHNGAPFSMYMRLTCGCLYVVGIGLTSYRSYNAFSIVEVIVKDMKIHKNKG